MFVKTLLCLTVLFAVAPMGVHAQSPSVSEPFDTIYERYVEVAMSLHAKVQQNSATLDDHKKYLDAVIKVFIAQNSLILQEGVTSVQSALEEDTHYLQALNESVLQVADEEDLQAVADELKEYIDSYATAVRKPMLVAFAERFMADVYVPALDRYSAMKQAVDGAKKDGINTDEFDAALQRVRLQLYEVKGFADDVRAMLAQETFSLEDVDADMTKAQEIIKDIYGTFKDLSLKSGVLFAN
ncbi:hypothetical protein A2755_01395 [Candidatus Wolfebacteria bacterium RIFCSPHIGHO2_01_FULL_48_22]|uniref:DUF5667 domain-containing protein n=2 Tax=Candidatus Wolfeibacteriota TaxID=1752735 RepID=A0A1F8DUT6_9BACT|nr:MAG: hypothetical protein A2755_01395 [Candidatus Wolfebacteria bacterium RIFCSPHIGHO2_01_FULL_48_22]OGM93894.1 MAG: hypothetical protein A2935_03390 [Candidatus Wolfebacteria bacterium RIFCSPLOWO2_01_FULL_47_17b]